MKKTSLCLIFLLTIFGATGMASAALLMPPTTFDFDSLRPGDNAAAISCYMTDIYGAGVGVTGWSVDVEGSWLQPGLLGGFQDRYVESDSYNQHQIVLSFAVPIISVQFDWATSVDAFNAYSDAIRHLIPIDSATRFRRKPPPDSDRFRHPPTGAW